MSSRILGPAGGDARPEFSQGIAVTGQQTLVFLAGQVAVDDSGQVVGDTVAEQAGQVFRNLGDLLAEASATFEHVGSFTTYLTSDAGIPDFVAFRRDAFPGMFPGGRYPTNTLLVVSELARPAFLIEVSAIAAMPAPAEAG